MRKIDAVFISSHRPSIKGTKLLFIVIKAIIIIYEMVFSSFAESSICSKSEGSWFSTLHMEASHKSRFANWSIVLYHFKRNVLEREIMLFIGNFGNQKEDQWWSAMYSSFQKKWSGNFIGMSIKWNLAKFELSVCHQLLWLCSIFKCVCVCMCQAFVSNQKPTSALYNQAPVLASRHCSLCALIMHMCLCVYVCICACVNV